MECPCRYCKEEDRYINCHSVCDQYINWCNTKKEEKERERKDKETGRNARYIKNLKSPSNPALKGGRYLGR